MKNMHHKYTALRMSKYESGMYEYMPTAALSNVTPLTSGKLQEMHMIITDSIKQLNDTDAPNNIDLNESIQNVKRVAEDLITMIKILEARAAR
jgi:hypothetical protein